MSLASLLSIARSAMFAQQSAMSVTAHNVANAQTPGYSRQRLELAAAAPQLMPTGPVGRGVTEVGILRVRNTFFDSRYRSESGLLGNSATLGDFLGQVEAAIHEPSADGLAASLDGLFGSFANLANNPTSSTSRSLVQQAGRRFVQQLQQLDAAVHQVADGAYTQMRDQVGQVNDLARQIADLNSSIRASGGPIGSSPDLQDRRDVLVDQLSSLVGVRVLDRDDGTIGLAAGDTILVDGGSFQTLSVNLLAGGGFSLITVGGGTMDPKSGSLRALCELTTTTLPGIQRQLDSLAQALVTTVNAIHRSGFTLNGATNTDFFDPAGVTAQTIALAPAIIASGDAIAAAGIGAPGDGTIAQQLAALATTGVAALGGRSFRDFYIDLSGEIGSSVSSASQDADAHLAMVDQADTLRSSVSGVSVDEEMVALISQQQAYTAAARIVNVANEMMQSVLEMI
jgi:flagellar hook-associated protein 1 FlgK